MTASIMVLDDTAALGIAVAFGCGLLLGIERERRRGDRPRRRHPGVRSFALTATIGALAQALAGQLVLPGAFLVAALTLAARWRDRSASERGIATELALFLCYLLGVGAIGNPALMAGIAVILALTLNLRDTLHQFARSTLRPGELRDALIFAFAVAIIMPLLPDENVPWLLGLNPRTLWTLVITIMGIQAAAHITLRAAGPAMGLAASGLASGCISGVATIATMGMRGREHPDLRPACISAALASNISTFLLLWIVAWTVAPAQFGVMVPLLTAGTLAAAAVTAISLYGQPKAEFAVGSSAMFSIRQALLFAVALSGASAALAYANAHLGVGVAITGAALAGFFDVHAAAGSALGLLANGSAPAPEVQLSVLLAISCNMVSKGVGAFAGGASFAVHIIVRLCLILAATWAPYLLIAPL
jgi:uncharacterized membrane protein (DUF4010 family)